MTSARLLAGVVEGFYGRPWNPRQRHQLFQWLRDSGLNTYLYAPKDDLKHRACWRQSYDEAEGAEVGALIRDCHRHELEFFYGLAPGLDLHFTDPLDAAALEARVTQLASLGCRHFALLFDDIPAQLAADDLARFGSAAAAQAQVANELLAWVKARTGGRLLFCPTVYCGRMAQPTVAECGYLRELGQRLAPEIGVLWTGPEIVSERIPLDSLRTLREVLRRKPVLWDNLHANDYDARRLYVGPYSGRAPELREEVDGILLNPNCQFEVNYVPVKTLGAYVQAAPPPRVAYLQALEAWLPSFATCGPQQVSRDELLLLGDLFYLPTGFGERGRRFLDDCALLLRTPPAQWGSAAGRFAATCQQLLALAEKLTALKGRDLLHALYSQVWELKETVLLLQAWSRWRQANPADRAPFRAGEWRPGLFRGSLGAVFERWLPMDDQGGFVPAAPAFAIKRSGPEDEDGAYEVCLKTGDAGQDGAHLYPDDPRALGNIFVGPYLRLEPELAFVLTDELGVCGYVLGAFDSEEFYRRFQDEWLPPFRARFPAPTGDPARWTPTQRLHYEYHHPDIYYPESFRPCPAHAHIDLLPRAQGRGWGRRMMEWLLERLCERGSPGVHLGLSAANLRAYHFYLKLGFTELARVGQTEPQVIYMGKLLQ